MLCRLQYCGPIYLSLAIPYWHVLQKAGCPKLVTEVYAGMSSDAINRSILCSVNFCSSHIAAFSLIFELRAYIILTSQCYTEHFGLSLVKADVD